MNLKRGRGRPKLNSADSVGLVNRDMIVDLAFDLARTQSVDQISFVQLAKKFDVKPGAVHYHIGTKEDLVSAVLNRFYRELLEKLHKLPKEEDWRARISLFAHTLMVQERAHRGAAEHIQTHAKFRVFQKTRPNETDYGAAYLSYAFLLIKDAGFTAETTAMFYHVLALHCLSTATSASTRLEPAAHEDFLTEKADGYAPGELPGLEFALCAFARVRSDDAFEIGLTALLDHFAPLRRSEV